MTCSEYLPERSVPAGAMAVNVFIVRLVPLSVLYGALVSVGSPGKLTVKKLSRLV